MNQYDIWQIARQQSAIDCHCQPEDFLKNENIAVVSLPDHHARRYLKLPFSCQLVSYGHNIVASGSLQLLPTIQSYIDRYPDFTAFETPHILELDHMLAPYGRHIHYMAEYFLPDLSKLNPTAPLYSTRLLKQEDFHALYTPQWSHALCQERAHLDIMGMGAYNHGQLIGLAACSMDCDHMWQIGIDVLPAYRKQGIAGNLVAMLAKEILACHKVPFYCCAWSNLASKRTAIKAGFRPAWVELTAK